MFEESKNALRYSEKLIKAECHDPKIIQADIVPKDIGVYLWRSKSNNEIVYVGRALGKAGLYQRIIRQHLSVGYAKSVFRLQIADEFGLNPIKESTFFIKDNFVFSFVTFDRKDKNIASFVEASLIFEYSPKYNREGNY